MSRKVKCTCGRSRGDRSDYVVVAYKSGHGKNSAWSKVKCTRPGCPGAKRTKRPWVDELWQKQGCKVPDEYLTKVPAPEAKKPEVDDDEAATIEVHGIND